MPCGKTFRALSGKHRKKNHTSVDGSETGAKHA
jgi:hypothetical protein